MSDADQRGRDPARANRGRPARRPNGARRAALIVSVPLVFLISGCAPLGAENLNEFVVDFARSALAAWLL